MMKNNLTEIIFLLDRSGSMSGLEADTIGGFNSFIERQKELGGNALITTVLFDDRYEILWDGKNICDIKLSSKEYYVRGSTALLDAIGKTILDVSYRISRKEKIERPNNVIFVITTDGMENSSKEFTYEKIKSLILHQQKLNNWSFIFLGANIDVIKEASELGIDKSNAYVFEASESGMKTMYNTINRAVSEKRENK